MEELLEERPAALPWTTPPSDLGGAPCAWCGRVIYRPAVHCSVQPPAGLAEMDTANGSGRRCQYELRTRGHATRPALG